MRISLFESPDSDRPVFALLLLLTGVIVLAFQDSLVKLMSVHSSFWQFQTLRSLGNLVFLLLLARIGGGVYLLRAVNTKAVWFRAVLMTICMFCFFSAAPLLSVAQMAAGLYTYPIFVSLLAAPVLGETVGRWRVAALAVGAMGAVLVLSPWDDRFSWVQILPVMAGFFYALNILTLRKACRKESPLALAFSVAIMFLVTGVIGIITLSVFPIARIFNHLLPFVTEGWPTLTLIIVGFAVLCSILNLTGNICLSRAYQTADSSWLAPLDFSYLIFAAIWSKVLFDQWPENIALAGMALIAIAGIITAVRENRVAKTA